MGSEMCIRDSRSRFYRPCVIGKDALLSGSKLQDALALTSRGFRYPPVLIDCFLNPGVSTYDRAKEERRGFAMGR